MKGNSMSSRLMEVVHHGADQADALGQPYSSEGGDALDVGAEKYAPQQGRLHPKALVEPVSYQALDDEAACEGIQREERRQTQHHPA
jgi:hypothetical protein